MTTTARPSLPLLTTSSARAYRACPRLYYYEYEKGYRPAGRNATTDFGTLGHRGLEAWWKAKLAAPTDTDSWLAAAVADVDEWDADEFTKAAHVALLTGYHVFWSSSTIEPLPDGIEHEYTGPLINPATGAPSRTWQAAGKIDVIAHEPTTREVWVLDHKFTSEDFSAGSDYRIRLTLDPQVSNYLAAVRRKGYEPAGWIHDCIKRPGLKPLKATPLESRKMTQGRKSAKTGEWLEAPRLVASTRIEDETPEEYGARVADDIMKRPEVYYARVRVVRLASEEAEAAYDYHQTGVQIRDSRSANVWPRNPASCLRYGRSCAFLPVCSGQASLEDGTRYRKAERSHEELGIGVQSVEKEEEVAAQ